MRKGQIVTNSVDKNRKMQDFWLGMLKEKMNEFDYTQESFKRLETEKGKKVIELNTDLYNQLVRVCKGDNLAIYTFVLSVFSTLMYRRDNHAEGMFIGTPVYLKSGEALPNVILPLKCEFDGEMTFKEALINIKDGLQNSYKNQIFPLQKILLDIDVFDIVPISFAMRDIHKEEDIENILRQEKCKFTVVINKVNEKIFIEINYDRFKFNKEEVDNICSLFKKSLSTTLENIEVQLSEMDVVTGDEKNRLLHDFNKNKLEYPNQKTIVELFEERVEKNPDNIAVEIGSERISYAELNKKANSFGAYLRENGVGVGSIVGIMQKKSIEMIVGIIGILKAGGTYLPIDFEQPQSRIENILEDSGCEVLLTSPPLTENIEYSGKVFDLLDVNLYKKQVGNLLFTRDSTNAVYVLYTSGTTGKPKGTVVKHKNLTNFLWAIQDQFRDGFSPQDKVLSLTNTAFDVSACEMFVALIFGATLVLNTKEKTFDPKEVADLIVNYKITFTFIPPSLLEFVYEALKPKKKELVLDKILIGVEPIKGSTVKKLKSLNERLQIINGYGPTEATICATFYKVTGKEKENTIIPIGKPIANTQIYILNQSMGMVPVGVDGEIFISGDGVASGYLNNLELTKDSFIKNAHYNQTVLYRTGDIARWLPDGNIKFIGRKDDQVKLRGFRISLGEIEARILEYEHVDKVLVIIKEDERQNKYLCAYVISGQEIDKDALKKYLKSKIPDYMIPDHIMQVENFPMTANGKINKKAFPDPVVVGVIHDPPRNRSEEIMAKIWSDILGVKCIGIDDNFFDLGGHSLKAVLLTSEIYKELNVVISVKEIFANPTIKGISNVVREAEVKQFSIIEKVDEQEFYESSSVQKRLYLMQEMNKKATNYNMPIAIELKGKLNKDKLNDAFKGIITQHESLRTSFETVNGKVMQRINKINSFELEYVDLGENGIEKELQSFLRPFNLNQAPLIRCKLLRKADEEHVLLVDTHHIISDGTSHAILFRDLFQLYNGNELKPLGVQYKDYARWQNVKMNSEEYKKQKMYWMSIYEEQAPALNLPYDYIRKESQDFKGAVYKFMIEGKLVRELNKILKENDVTMYMVLLSSLNILLSKYSGQEDIVVGSPVAGRNHPELHDVVGMFVNTLPMRCQPIRDLTYAEFLSQIKAHVVEGLENADYQYEDLVNALNVKKTKSGNILFDVLFAFQNFSKDNINADGLKIQYCEFKDNTTKFDLALFASESDDGICCEFQYSTDLFKGGTIIKFAEHLVNIIKKITENPRIHLEDIDLKGENEFSKVTQGFNETYTMYDSEKTVCDIIQESVIKNPQKIALICNGEKLTYEQLGRKTDMIASYLIEKANVEKGSFIGILMDRSEWLIMSMLGILKAGAAYVPLDPNMPYERIKTIIEDARIGTIISMRNQIGKLNKLQWECKELHTYLCVDTEDIHGVDISMEKSRMDEEVWEYIGKTSTDAIDGGGWINSYTGEKFSEIEMKEYEDNTYNKLLPYLKKDSRVLEIGCASGISMFRIATDVNYYLGTDLSRIIIEKNRKRVDEEKIDNIGLKCLKAHEIDQINDGKFDVIILNSVIQYFSSHNYLKDVIRKCIDLLSENGIIYLGDIMDLDLKSKLVKSLNDFRENNPKYSSITKIDFSSELFISRNFINDLRFDFRKISDIIISEKEYSIKNELTQYRYDAILEFNKIKNNDYNRKVLKRCKQQHGINILENSKEKRSKINLTGEDEAYAIYTSGSTGTPKGVIIQHKAISNFIKAMSDKIDFDSAKTILSVTNISFDIFVLESLLPLARGMTILIANENEQIDGRLLGKLIEEAKVDMVQMTPSRVQMLLNYEQGLNYLENISELIVGGETLTEEIFRKISTLKNTKIYNVYGPTETTVWSTLKELKGESAINIGTPLINTQVYILDHKMKAVPIGVTGEIYIGGESLAKNYLNNPELTTQKFVASPFCSGKKLYRTGDLGRWTINGEIQFLGRGDNQIKIRGFRVELGEIENTLLTHEAVQEVVVVLSEDKGSNSYLTAFVVLDEMIDHSELREYLNAKLPSYMVPSYYFEIDKIPLNLNGKRDRKSLELKAKSMRIGKEIIEARNDVERDVCLVWRSILNIENIGITDNFFELGGHSLNATSLVVRLNKKYNIDLLVSDIFMYPTVKELAEYIGSLEQYEHLTFDKVEEKEYYPLSHAQKRIYIVNQMQSGSTNYNMPCALTIDGVLNIKRLEEIFKLIVERHEVFRTSFHVIEDKYMQKIHGESRLQLEYVQSRTVDIENEIIKFVKPFDLEKEPLLRVKLIQISEEQSLLLYDMHHIICDGVSQGILIKEFVQLYSGENLPEIKIRYRDYVNWQEKFRSSEIFERQKRFWMKKFSGEIPLLNMPVDFKRKERQGSEGESLKFEIDSERSKRIQELTNETGTTLFMVMLSAYYILLSKYTGEKDIIVGCPIAERTHADTEGIIGMFVNTLPIRYKVNDENTFEELLMDLKGDILEVYANQNYQLDDIVRNLPLKRAINSNPLFNVLLTMQNTEKQEISVSGLKIQNYEMKNIPAKFDISLTISENDGIIDVILNYKVDLFKMDSMIKFGEHFLEVIEQITDENKIKIKDVKLKHMLKYVSSKSIEDVEFTF